MRMVVIVLGCFAIAGCRRAARADDTTSARQGASEVDHSRINDAFLAKLGGWGGCGRIDSIDSIPNPYIGGVRILRGRCTADHGDTLQTLVVVDTTGQIFLQNSLADYAYLLRRHPLGRAVKVASVDYATFALKLSGMIAPDASPVFTEADLPSATRKQLRLARFSIPLSGVADSEPAANVFVTTAHADTLREYTMLLADDGQLMVLNHKLVVVKRPR